MPDDSTLSDLELLEQSLEVAEDADIRDSHRAFHEWRREKVLAGFTVEEAQTEMRAMTERHRSARLWRNLRKGIRVSTVVASVAVGAVAALTVPLIGVAAPLVPAAGEGLLRLLVGKHSDTPPPAAMFHEARERLRRSCWGVPPTSESGA